MHFSAAGILEKLRAMAVMAAAVAAVVLVAVGTAAVSEVAVVLRAPVVLVAAAVLWEAAGTAATLERPHRSNANQHLVITIHWYRGVGHSLPAGHCCSVLGLLRLVGRYADVTAIPM
jgi:hypothetical protein